LRKRPTLSLPTEAVRFSQLLLKVLRKRPTLSLPTEAVRFSQLLLKVLRKRPTLSHLRTKKTGVHTGF
jgi:hypothetical protein